MTSQGRSPDPDKLDLPVRRCYGPDGGTTTRTVPAAGIVHVRYSVDAVPAAWKGVGPLKRAALDADLLSAIVTRLGEESGAPVAHVIPSPPSMERQTPPRRSERT